MLPANSVLHDFGHDVVLRVPKVLYPASVIPKEPSQPIKAEALSMTFWYPDMTPTDWVSAMDTIIDKARGVYVPQSDRFRVRIVWLFYSPNNWRNLSPGEGKLIEPGPDQILKNRACCDERGLPRKMVHVPSGLPGLEALKAADWIEKHPEQASHDPQEGGTYVAARKAPYELVMDCDGPEKGVECVAHVYSKTQRFQYRMIFPPEAVRHTDELIRAIDRMLNQWHNT
jgi:hypothetical protein